jgi:hypothetical protein
MDLVPYGLRAKVKDCKVPEHEEIYGVTQEIKLLREIRYAILGWLAGRVLSIDRKNAKKILNSFGFSQSQDSITKAGIALKFRGQTLKDDYWIKFEDEDIKYNEISLRNQNPSNKMIQLALHGRSSVVADKGSVEAQDIMTVGSYAKSWIREEDGLYLYKAGINKNVNESLIEVSVSNILDKFNVRHLRYEKAMHEGVVCCKCKCMSDMDHSIVHAAEVRELFDVSDGEQDENYDLLDGALCGGFQLDDYLDKLTEYYRAGDERFLNWVSSDKRFSNDFHKMIVIDYLIANEDRHSQNWGFYMDNRTGELNMLHPLYDHNNAFRKEYLYNISGGPSRVYNGRSKLEAAMESIKHCDIKQTGTIRRSDFVNKEHMEAICERMNRIGIKFKYGIISGITPI